MSFGVSRRLCTLAAAVALAFVPSIAAAEEASPYSFSFGTDSTSHFISYGADVWGGGDGFSPFSAKSTQFVYGTLTTKFSDQLSGFVNVWTDNNDNVNSEIGGPIQEVDVNVGFSYSMDKFTFGAATGWWMYAGDDEKIAAFSVSFNDADMIKEGFALNPSATLHWRYDGNGGQEEGFILNLGIKPATSFEITETIKPAIAFPINAGIFITDDFHGGDAGLGYVNVGVAATFPLTFIPERFGSWAFTPSVTFWWTPDDVIPGNPEEAFFVTALSIGGSF